MARSQKPQIQKFRETAREVEADQPEAAFSAAPKKSSEGPASERVKISSQEARQGGGLLEIIL
jgi:hypothetical protein